MSPCVAVMRVDPMAWWITPLSSTCQSVPGFGPLWWVPTAVRCAGEQREADVTHGRALQRRLMRELPPRIPMLGVTGPQDAERRLPGSVSVVIAFVEGESILLALDLAGIAASSGSACTTGSVEPSHVLAAMGLDPDLAKRCVRFTFGRRTTDEDIDYVLEVLPEIIEKLRGHRRHKLR